MAVDFSGHEHVIVSLTLLCAREASVEWPVNFRPISARHNGDHVEVFVRGPAREHRWRAKRVYMIETGHELPVFAFHFVATVYDEKGVAFHIFTE